MNNLIKRLRDPEEAAAHLTVALNGNDPAVFLLAIRDIIAANGGIAKIAKTAGVSASTVSRTLSPQGIQELFSFKATLAAYQMSMEFVPQEETESSSR